MISTSNQQANIVRTERGLTIARTRITLYDVMDHIKAGWPPKLIRNWLPLTEAQIQGALSYIEANQNEVEAEYQICKLPNKIKNIGNIKIAIA